MRSISLPGLCCSLWLLIPVLMSCSHTKQSPIAPDAAPAVVDPTVLPFAALDLVIDADAVDVQVEQRTVAAAGESLTIDLSTFMRTENALRIDGIRRIDPDTLGLTISIRHPIPMPPEGQEPKFHATDVLGVFVFDDTHAMDLLDDNVVVHLETVVPGFVEADGYTGVLWNSLRDGFPSSSTLFPYVLLSEDTRTPNYDPDTDRGWLDVRNPVGFNVLPQGSDWRSTEARLHLPPGQHRVRLAVQGNLQEVPLFDAAGQPQVARYCYPEGSLQAPWKIETEIWNAGLIGGNEYPGTCEVDVKVYDWQHSATVAAEWSATATKGQVREASSVELVSILVPDLDSESKTTTTAISGNGQPNSPYSATLQITNRNRAPGGFYWGFVIVQDTRLAGRLYDRDLAEIVPQSGRRYSTGQVVAIPVASSVSPDFVTHVRASPSGQVFVAAGTPKTLTFREIWASGASTPIDKSQFENVLDAGNDAEMVGAYTVRRLSPRDSSSAVILRTTPLDPGRRIRATTSIVLGEPYADFVQGTSWSCGASGGFPERALGGPRGAGTAAGNTDHVYTIGYGGSIQLEMRDGWILDKPGPDFIVYENAFEIGQDPDQIFTEAVKVGVAMNSPADYRYASRNYSSVGDLPWRRPWNFSGFAGIHPVLANIETNTIDPTDPVVAGGDAFDLADFGVPYARLIILHGTGLGKSSPCYAGCNVEHDTDSDGDLIDDEGKHGTCSGSVGGPDIDAVAIVKGHQGFPEQ